MCQHIHAAKQAGDENKHQLARLEDEQEERQKVVQ
jgi:hypothetical protein